MLIFCDFIQVYVFTTNHHLNWYKIDPNRFPISVPCMMLTCSHMISLTVDRLPSARKALSYLWDEVCSIFSGAGKFCVARGLGQFSRDVKSDVRTQNFRCDLCFTTKHVEWRSDKVVMRRKM